jgi:hypothetical protein
VKAVAGAEAAEYLLVGALALVLGERPEAVAGKRLVALGAVVGETALFTHVHELTAVARPRAVDALAASVEVKRLALLRATEENRAPEHRQDQPGRVGHWQILRHRLHRRDVSGAWLRPRAPGRPRPFAYSDELRTAGAKVALGTVLPVANNALHNGNRVLLNGLIRDNLGVHLDAVIDYAADSMIGPDDAATSLTYYSDGVHPTWGAGGGQERMFLVYKPVVDTLLMKDP